MEQAQSARDGRTIELELAAGLRLAGDLTVPCGAKALVIFAHGSGSNRNSPRNRFVARRLQAAGYGTLLVDLLPESEEEPLQRLAERLLRATTAAMREAEVSGLAVAYFGASTGAAVALLAAAQQPSGVIAVVSRGGRPDLVPEPVLARVRIPVLLIVGSLDGDVLALNRRAARALRCPCEVEVITGASHLFEEPGTLERVADSTLDFLGRHLGADAATEALDDPPLPTRTAREDGPGLYDDSARGTLFEDRKDAGRQLATALERYRGTGALVLGVPRGGVPVAYEVATRLDLPLDVLVARKLGAPGQEELAIGAITADGTLYRNEDIIRRLRVGRDYLERVTDEQASEARRRERVFRAGRPPLQLRGRSVIVVDDGLATGATVRAVVRALRAAKVGHLTVAIPVGAPSSCAELAAEVDELVCLHEPAEFDAVGAHYVNFGQTDDSEVERLLKKSLHQGKAKEPLPRADSRS